MTLATISRHWLAALTMVLAACYILLGATALGVAGVLGIAGGVVVLIAIVASSRLPAIARRLVLAAAVLPFAILSWWSIVTPLLALLIVAIGWPSLHPIADAARPTGDSETDPRRTEVSDHEHAAARR